MTVGKRLVIKVILFKIIRTQKVIIIEPSLISLGIILMMAARHDLLHRMTELQLSDLLGLGVHHLERLLAGPVLNQVLVLVIHHSVDMDLLIVGVLGLPPKLQTNRTHNSAGSAPIKLNNLAININ